MYHVACISFILINSLIQTLTFNNYIIYDACATLNFITVKL